MTAAEIAEQIEKAMEGASKGPWEIATERDEPLRLHVVGPSDVVVGLDGICEAARNNDRSFVEDEANMRFIAACNPSNMRVLLDKLAEAVKVLEPFAECAGSYDPNDGDSGQIAWAHDFTIGSLRAAAPSSPL